VGCEDVNKTAMGLQLAVAFGALATLWRAIVRIAERHTLGPERPPRRPEAGGGTGPSATETATRVAVDVLALDSISVLTRGAEKLTRVQAADAKQAAEKSRRTRLTVMLVHQFAILLTWIVYVSIRCAGAGEHWLTFIWTAIACQAPTFIQAPPASFELAIS
jgi:hypothetical protein